MSQEIIMQTNPASRILVYSSSIETARKFVRRVKALSASSKGDRDTEPEALESLSNPDTISHTLSNKYYTADVHFSLRSTQTLTSEVFHHTNAPPALIYVWTTSEPYTEHIQLLSQTMQSMEYEPEVCLAVRVAVSSDPTTPSTESPTTDQEENTEIDTSLLTYGFEYVDASRERARVRVSQADEEISGADSDEDDDDIPDLPRVLDALSTIMWSTMRSTQSAQNPNPETNAHQLNQAEKEERDALLEDLLAAGQEVRSSESQATQETANKEKSDDDDDDEEKLMQLMEAFIKDTTVLSSFSSFKGTNIDFPSGPQFSPIGAMGSLDSMFDFSAFTGQSSQTMSRSGSIVPLIDARTKGAEPKNNLWLDIDSTRPLPLINALTSASTSSQTSSHPSTALTASPVDEQFLDSFGKVPDYLPTITKHAFDDDFTDFVSAPISQPSVASSSTTPFMTNPSQLSLPVPSLRRSASRSSSFASDFGEHDDEHVYAMLDDASSYGGDDLDQDLEDESKAEENLPDLHEILATTRQLFGGQIPVRKQGDAAVSSNSTSDPQPTMGRDSDPNSAGALGLESVLSALQRFKTEIGGMSDEEEKKKMAARVALGLVYGLEGQDESDGKV